MLQVCFLHVGSFRKLIPLTLQFYSAKFVFNMFDLNTIRNRKRVNMEFLIFFIFLCFVGYGCIRKLELNMKNMAVDLKIDNRNWDPDRPDKNVGWCAEACIQMAMEFYGVKISQSEINKAGTPHHADLYMDDIDVALKMLSVKFISWDNTNRDLDEYILWVKKMLDLSYPVICGVKIYPDERRCWFLDHFVLVTGYNKRGMLINTNMKGKKLISYEQLTSRKQGFSFKNRHKRYFARAITGVNPKSKD